MADTWIDSDHPDDTHGAEPNLPVRVSGGIQRLLFKFDTKDLTRGTVTDATLYFYVSISDPDVTVFVYSLTSAFDETQTTWVDASTVPWTNQGGDYNPASIAGFQATGNCLFQLDVKTLAQAWVDTPSSNQGLILIAIGQDGKTATISSKESGDGPILSVTTTP